MPFASSWEPQRAIEHWLEPKVVGKRRTVKVRTPVAIADLDGRQEAATGELLELCDAGDGRLDAVLRLEETGGTPPVRGRILAIDDLKEQRQRERRKRALDRLRHGTGANPELLGWLLNPHSIAEITLAGDPGRSTRTALDPYQRRAVGLATQIPSLVLVLGPPGAGKTTVIRSILDELRRRRADGAKGRKGGDSAASLRVLVTSPQNEAVRNAVEKISDDAGLEVGVLGDKDERADQRLQLADRAKRIAAALWKDLRDTPRFLSSERARLLHERLGQIRETLYEIGIGPILLARLQELAAAEVLSALTALLQSQLSALITKLAAALTSKPADPLSFLCEGPTPVAAALAAIVAVLRMQAPERRPHDGIAPADVKGSAGSLTTPAASPRVRSLVLDITGHERRITQSATWVEIELLPRLREPAVCVLHEPLLGTRSEHGPIAPGLATWLEQQEPCAWQAIREQADLVALDLSLVLQRARIDSQQWLERQASARLGERLVPHRLSEVTSPPGDPTLGERIRDAVRWLILAQKEL